MRVALTAALLALGFAACGSATDPAASTCGGSHDWPPTGYIDLSVPPGVSIEAAGPDTVRVRNGSDRAWRFETAVWSDAPCVGFVAESPIRSGPIEPGHLVTTQIDPLDQSSDVPIDHKVGVAVFAPDCDETCLDEPVGFGWIDIPEPLPS
jgi:hypothetical protein